MPSVTVLRPQAVIWRDPPRWSFRWRGLVPLLALLIITAYALGPFAHAIQDGVQAELHAQLIAAGFGWVTVRAAGQDVILTGAEPAAGAGERALALARSARCPSLLGHFTCAARVAGHFESAAAAAAGPATANEAAQACDRAFVTALAGEQIAFASGSASIAPESSALLERLAAAGRHCGITVRIEGHTDLIGRDEFNRALSEARARAVREALIARGVSGTRLLAQGFGARHPIADNTTDSGRARNRRIEFHTVSTE
jgi:outer membrane protein OmpA-like peptidoglycan-associated protein